VISEERVVSECELADRFELRPAERAQLAITSIGYVQRVRLRKQTTPCGWSNPSSLRTTFRASMSIAPTVLFPSSATNSRRCDAASMEPNADKRGQNAGPPAAPR
jgi:hypothetical protein